MTLDEKLDIFYKSSIDKATSQSSEMIEEYKTSLAKIYDEHMEESKRKAEVTLRVETDHLIREKNKLLSAKALEIRRDFTEHTTALKEQLFKEVEEQLQAYMRTSEYITLLENRIKKVQQFAKDAPVTIYINASDADKKSQLEAATNAELTIHATDFMGGIRAVIHSRNILMDYSFTSKLLEVEEAFTLYY